MTREYIEGLSDLREKLSQLKGLAGQRVLASAARVAMTPVLEEAQTLVPVASGQLRDSLRIATVKPTSGTVIASAGITFAKRISQEVPAVLDEDESVVEGLGQIISTRGAGWRWHFVEFGTPHMPAKPFLRPAWEMHRREVLDLFQSFLRKKLEKALRKQLAAESE